MISQHSKGDYHATVSSFSLLRCMYFIQTTCLNTLIPYLKLLDYHLEYIIKNYTMQMIYNSASQWLCNIIFT